MEVAWGKRYDELSAVARPELGGDGLEELAVAAFMTGQDDVCAEAWEAAHRAHLDGGEPARAARCGFWLAFGHMMRGQMAQAGGWLARTERLIQERELDCSASGFLLIPAALGALGEGDPDAARAHATRIFEIGERFADADLRAFGTLGHGQALIAAGDIDAGIALLDEVMVSVASGEVGPITTGIVYCAVVLECMQTFDLRRAAEWTDALSDWCDAQPGLVPYRGQCLVHRSQLQQAAGRWPDAVTTAEEASQRLSEPPHPALGLAHYQEAEMHRLLGEFDEAERRYGLASRTGYHPVPGLALLELARGNADTAAVTIRHALEEITAPANRPALLAGAVDVLWAAADREGLRAVADELSDISEASSAEALGAMAEHARGVASLADGDHAAALPALRAAAAAWQRLQMPYEAARTAVHLGLACTAIGDQSSAGLHFESARECFEELGARPDLDRLARLEPGVQAGHPSTLSDRELEVLGLVVAGKTNREIASELVISQHTVGRHVENIFSKLGVNSRAAATAYAYEHDLL